MTSISLEFSSLFRRSVSEKLWQSIDGSRLCAPISGIRDYGAGGSTRDRGTHQCVKRIIDETDENRRRILTCVAASRKRKLIAV